MNESQIKTEEISFEDYQTEYFKCGEIYVAGNGQFRWDCLLCGEHFQNAFFLEHVSRSHMPNLHNSISKIEDSPTDHEFYETRSSINSFSPVKEENDIEELFGPSTTSFNDPLALLLRKWDLYEELYDLLSVKEITLEGLKYMKERHLDDIFQNHNLNYKIIFEHKLGIWQNKFGVCNLNSALTTGTKGLYKNSNKIADSGAPPISGRICADTVKVADILEKSEQGKTLSKTYAKTKSLTPEQRTFIVHKIIQHFIENDIYISVKTCKNLAEQIVKNFPTEKIDTYFVQAEKRHPPKGKLWDRYQGRKRVLRTFSTVSKKPRKLLHNTEQTDDEEYEKIAAELKNIRDWEEVLIKWKKTFPFRKASLQKQHLSLTEILHNWPLFKYSRAPELVDLDYGIFCPTKNFNFGHWEKFRQVAESIFSERVKDTVCKTFLKQTIAKREHISEDNVNICFLKLLHALLIPTSKVVGGSRVKYTIADSQQSFTLQVGQVTDIDSILLKKREECAKNKSTLQGQPLMVVVGDEFKFKNFYVILHDSKFLFSTYIEALEYCFKLMCVLNLQYPIQSMYVWIFIQKFLFDIHTGIKSPVVDTLIQDINTKYLSV